MRNLWQFIVNNIHLLLFILLEVVAFWLITYYQPYPRSTFFTSANSAIAWLNAGTDDMASYFRLHRDNELLTEEIANLQEQVQLLQNKLEWQTEKQMITDTTNYIYAHLGYHFIPARVIDLTTSHEHNYLTINKGSRDGLAEGMGVVMGNRVVGIISNVNERFAQVVPLIHTSCSLSSRILKNGQIGFTRWNGSDASHIQLMEIGRHVPVEDGDTIVTSGLTLTFPEGLLIGVADKVELTEGDNYYQIRVRLGIDYQNIRYVQVLANPIKEQLDSLSHE